MTDQPQQYYEGLGRRKASVARVRIYPGGTGNLVANDRPGEEYFNREADVLAVMAPLRLTELDKSLDISVLVNGGGITGQAEATRQGVARALVSMDETLRAALGKAGFLTRDARVKERKKPGLKRARKAPTYTKR